MRALRHPKGKWWTAGDKTDIERMVLWNYGDVVCEHFQQLPDQVVMDVMHIVCTHGKIWTPEGEKRNSKSERVYSGLKRKATGGGLFFRWIR